MGGGGNIHCGCGEDKRVKISTVGVGRGWRGGERFLKGCDLLREAKVSVFFCVGK